MRPSVFGWRSAMSHASCVYLNGTFILEPRGSFRRGTMPVSFSASLSAQRSWVISSWRRQLYSANLTTSDIGIAARSLESKWAHSLASSSSVATLSRSLAFPTSFRLLHSIRAICSSCNGIFTLKLAQAASNTDCRRIRSVAAVAGPTGLVIHKSSGPGIPSRRSRTWSTMSAEVILAAIFCASFDRLSRSKSLLTVLPKPPA